MFCPGWGGSRHGGHRVWEAGVVLSREWCWAQPAVLETAASQPRPGTLSRELQAERGGWWVGWQRLSIPGGGVPKGPGRGWP